jgi:hypothetical protein
MKKWILQEMNYFFFVVRTVSKEACDVTYSKRVIASGGELSPFFFNISPVLKTVSYEKFLRHSTVHR